jgi:MFS transporter, putative metabolite:H+ symporter
MAPITGDSTLLSARLQRLPTTRLTWAFVLLLAGAFIVEAFDIGSLSVILPVLKPLMHLSALQVGLLAASSAVGLTIGMILAGLLADRFGRKRVLIGGMLWFSGLTLVSALAPDFETLLLLRGLSGLGMAPTFIMPYALVLELVPPRTRAGFAGVLEAALGVGYVGATVVGLVVLPRFAPEIGWRVFLLIAGLPITYVWVLWRYLPESPRWLSRTGRSDEAEGIVAAIERRVEQALSQKRGSRGSPGGVGFRHGSALVPPTSLPAADHPARDLALSPVHPELPRRGGAPGRAQPGGFL